MSDPTSEKIVLVGPVPARLADALAADGELMEALSAAGAVRFTPHPPGSAAFAAELRPAHVLVAIGAIPPASLAGAPELRLVSIPATGYQTYVDVESASRLGIEVAYVPSYGAESIAEHTLALILALAKRIVPADAAVRAGQWRAPGRSTQLAGAVAGVIGLGPTGARMVRLLEALGMDVLVWTRRQDPTRLAGTSARFAPLDQLVALADVITLHLALTPGTTGLLDADLLSRARPGTILANTARAELIAEGALEAHVWEGRIRAGLDVFRHEPITADDPWVGLGDRVVLTPHDAFNTPVATRALLLGAARNVAAWAHGAATNLVDPVPTGAQP